MYGLEQAPQQRQELRQYQLQRLEILAMSGDELNDFLDQAEAENPLIEVERDRSEIEKELSLARWLDRQPSFETSYNSSEPDGDEPMEPEIVDPQETTLEQYLRLQIDFSKLSAERTRMINFLLGNLEDNGRLFLTSEQAVSCCHGTAADADFCLELLRKLEPTGVCAGSLKECLLAQLHALTKRDPVAERLVETCLESIAGSSVNRLARKCCTKDFQIEAALELLRGLDPFPGSSFYRPSQVYVIPDVLASPSDGGWTVQLCDKWSGSIHLSQYYIQLLRNSRDKENTAYLYDRLRQAKALMTAIEQRRSTLLRLSEFIVAHQKAFLDCRGPLEPLTLSELAGELCYHESTVSRALRGKYLCCPRGTIPLRKFISSPVGNTGITNEDLAQKISGLIEREDKQLPLSDQQITEMLAKSGFAVSRRTVAKYRINLGIPNAFARRSDI
jgi:RNA polymerase sigma-54 factor